MWWIKRAFARVPFVAWLNVGAVFGVILGWVWKFSNFDFFRAGLGRGAARNDGLFSGKKRAGFVLVSGLFGVLAKIHVWLKIFL